MMVVFHHIIFQWSQLTGRYIGSNLASGVDIFFVISGFVMVYSTKAGDMPAGKFIVRRLVRIAPLYWAATVFMIVVLLVYPQAVKSAKLDWLHAAASLAFVAAHNPAYSDHSVLSYGPLVAPGWTLNLEMLFYLIFTIAIILARRRTGWFVLILTLPLLTLAGIGWAIGPGGWLGFYAQDILLEFLMGAAIGMVWLRRATSIPVAIGLLLLVAALCLLIFLPSYDGSRLLRYGILSFLIGVLGVSTTFPQIGWLHRLGDASYSIYLSHFFVLSAVAQIWRKLALTAEGFALFAVASASCAVIGGLVCWYAIEVPMTRSLQRFVARRTGS